MEREDIEEYTDLQREDIDPELFGAALAMQHIRKLLSHGGSEYGRAGDEDALQPEQIEAFIVHAIENAKKTKRFERHGADYTLCARRYREHGRGDKYIFKKILSASQTIRKKWSICP